MAFFEADDPAGPPRLNGEMVFDEPWESRSFAMAAALVEEGCFGWDDFRDHLIAAVRRWEADPAGPYRYYERWQEALESIAAARGIVAGPEVDELAATYAARPPGHDHGDHHHGHGDGHHHHGDHGHGNGRNHHHHGHGDHDRGHDHGDGHHHHDHGHGNHQHHGDRGPGS